MVTYVQACPYDSNFFCGIGCEAINDKPWWCTHKLDLYEKALELEKEKSSGIEIVVSE